MELETYLNFGINPTNPVEIIVILCYRHKALCCCCYVQRTHSQVSPDDAVVRAPLSNDATVRRPCHAHGAAPPVVLWTYVRLQHCCKTHTHIQHRIFVTHKLIMHSCSFVPALIIFDHIFLMIRIPHMIEI